ncbi:MAG TPA: flippase [Clostridia bacterium]|nr:flippase [Clostridia bacterium]
MDSKRIINNSVALLVMDLVSKLLPLVTFPWVVRALGPESYGKVGFALAVTGFFGLLAAPGFNAFGQREIARSEDPARAVAQKLMGARMMLTCCSYLLLVVFTFTLAPPDRLTRTLLLLTGVNFLIATVDLQWLFLGNSRMWRTSVAGITGQCLYTAVVLGFVRKPSDAWLLPLGSISSGIVVALLLLQRARREFHVGLPRFVPELWGRFLPVCFTLGLASMMSMLYDQIDTVMLRYMRTEAEVGLYAASYRVMSISMSFLPVVAQVFYPLLSGAAGRDAERERRYVQWMANATVSLAIPMAIGGCLLAEPIAAFILGAKFAGSERLLRWLMLNLISASLAVLFGSRLVPHNRERKYLAAVAAGGVTNVLLNLILLPRFGALAAVWTTIVSQFAVAAMAFYFTRDLERPRLLQPICISLAAATAMGFTIQLIRHNVQLNVLFLVALGGLVYGGGFAAARSLWKKLQPAPAAEAA